MIRSFSNKAVWGVLVASAFIASGCAEEREPINRVQPNALDKSFFVGKSLGDPADDPEFYSAATVIDVPYGVNHGLFSGMAGGLRRLKWEITESKLVARQTYESYEGVDGRGSRRTNDGQAIAAFPIMGHFDIKRSYNPSTGEELNVVEENGSDRPWNERRYFRVDWSTNLVTSAIFWDPMAQNQMFGASYGVEPLAYYVNDPKNPDAPVFATGEGYFDVTQKIFVTPQTVTLDRQTYPTCILYGAFSLSGNAETGVCESSEIKIRMSFLKVKSPGDAGYQEYEPKHWDGARMDAFGIFTQDRKGYDNHFGIIDDKWYRFAQRYNIWAESFAKTPDGERIPCAGGYGNSTPDDMYDPNRDLDGDGTDDECTGAGAGSQCNVVERSCTIPYAKREIRTVAWHHHMMDDDPVITYWSERATEEWDTALRIAVQAARQAECGRTKGASIGQPGVDCKAAFPVNQEEEAELRSVRALNSCWAQHGRGSSACTPPSAVAAIKPVVAFCRNPVRDTDDPACGKPGTVTRTGDIRYHSINIWRSPENSSPWGFGPSWSDPLTGEIIQSSINVYNSVTDRAAQSTIDKARWYAGELTSDQVTTGEYVRNWVAAGASPLIDRNFQMTPEEVDHRVSSLAGARQEVEPRTTFDRNLQALQARTLKPLVQDLLANRAPPAIGGANRAEFQARVDAVKGTPAEAQLVGPMWVEAAGLDPATPITADVLETASPLRGMNFRNIVNMEEAVHRQLAKNGMCLYDFEAPEPSSVVAVHQLLERKFGALDPGATAEVKNVRLQKMWDYLRGKMHYGVLLHEMGHTIGLRHNFVSSYDKFNYRPQYWQLRTKQSSTVPPQYNLCTGPSPDGENCVGPRYYDPLTRDEIENSIYTWAQTTIMEYSGELTHDWLGLGIYDYAAARMFYGDVVDVRPDLALDCGGRTCINANPSSPATDVMDLVDWPGGLISQFIVRGNNILHYSQWNDYLGLVAGCRPASPEDLAVPAWWDADKYGAWDPVFDGEIVHNEVCWRPQVAYYSWREMRPDTVTDLRLGADPQFYTPRRPRTIPDEQQLSYVRVPYSFSSDEYRDGWTPSTLTRDAGADVYEQALWFLHQYENGHVFNNFRNHRTSFSIPGAYIRELSRTHSKLANFAQGLSILHDFYFTELDKNDPDFTYQDYVAAYEGEGGAARDHAVAASVVFDHFVRALTRPQSGLHLLRDGNLWISATDRIGLSVDPNEMRLYIPNGTSLAGNDVTFGGRPLDSGFEYGHGYWYSDYASQVGSYYEKTYMFDLLLSAYYRAPQAFSRWDGIDGRWRHTNFSNLYPDGIRRMMGVMLTEDWELIAPRVQATNGVPDLERVETGGVAYTYPSKPLGWVSFVPPAGPEVCFPSAGNYVCKDTSGSDVLPGTTAGSVPLEPQFGFETQKFLVFWAYVYMPSSQVMDFVDMMRIWKVGQDVDPSLAGQYIGWTDPDSGLKYYAKRYGNEQIFGKTYDKGIAAKMLQWANVLTERVYVLDALEPYDPVTGAANVQRDAEGNPVRKVSGDCKLNPDCGQLRRYRGLLDFTQDMAYLQGFYLPELPFSN